MAGVGVAVLIRRGWKAAGAIVAPLAVVFVIWYLSWGRQGTPTPWPTTSQVTQFAWVSASIVFGQLAQVELMGWVLVAVLVIGGVVLAVTTPRPELRRGARRWSDGWSAGSSSSP